MFVVHAWKSLIKGLYAHVDTLTETLHRIIIRLKGCSLSYLGCSKGRLPHKLTYIKFPFMRTTHFPVRSAKGLIGSSFSTLH